MSKIKKSDKFIKLIGKHQERKKSDKFRGTLQDYLKVLEDNRNLKKISWSFFQYRLTSKKKAKIL